MHAVQSTSRIKDKDALVSVIMPVYNAVTTVARAVESVLHQTYPHFELIVVDDASTDASADIISAFTDERIRLIRHASNRGVGSARNTAIAAARGDWVAMLDADDEWTPRRLSHLLGLGVSVTEGMMLADNIMHCYDVNGHLRPWRKQWTRKLLRFINGVTVLNLEQYLGLDSLLIQPLIPRHILAEYGIMHGTSPFGEDAEFYVRLMSRSGLCFKISEESLYLYRMTPGSMSARPDRAELMKRIWLKLLDELSFSPAERVQIAKRIERLDTDIRYMPFLTGLKSRRWHAVVSAFRKDPWVIGEFVRRLPASLPYRISLLLNRGQGR